MTEAAYERLYEAVNTGRLIGFVGSGLSLLYGSLSWKEFVAEVMTRLEHAVRELLEAQRYHQDANQTTRAPPSAAAEMYIQILAEIEALRCKDDDSIIVLEFARQSFRIVDLAKQLPSDQSYQDTVATIFESDKLFVLRAAIRRLELSRVLPDQDQINARVKAMAGKGAGANHPRLKDPKSWLVEVIRLKNTIELKKPIDPAEFGWPADVDDRIYRIASDIYDTRTLIGLAESLGKVFRRKPRHGVPDPKTDYGLVALAKELDKEPRRHYRGHRLPPDRRSILALFLSAVVLRHKERAPLALLNSIVANVTDKLAPPRPLIDPLRSLHENLAIRRFFTTNYDFELENLFMFDDFREIERVPITRERRLELLERTDFSRALDGASLIRHRPDGIRVRSDVNDGKHTAPLVEFGVGSSDSSIHIFHHHGRVDLPGTLIAADGEYNQMYRATGLNRASLDHAYDAMIEGNPIIFVGAGLTEEELTRTLRQRVSNRRTANDAPIFVLLPAKNRPAELMREQLNLAIKLDVRVIHYGHPRRGIGFSLRSHLLLLDQIAKRFLPHADDETLSRLRRARTPDQRMKAQRKIDLIESTRRGLWTYNIPPHDGIEEEYKNLEPFEGIDFDEISKRFGLIADFDFDHLVVKWLLSGDGNEFAKEVSKQATDDIKNWTDSSPHDGSGIRAVKLMLDYLKSVSVRLQTGAFRHELRQIGRESRAFFNRKSRMPAWRVVGRFSDRLADIEAGQLPSNWSRHLSVDGFVTDRKWQADRWDWSSTAVQGGQAVSFDAQSWFCDIDAIKPSPRSRSASWYRRVLIGDRGVGKGTFLKYLENILRTREDSLIVNCSFGQEVDSVVSLIAHFLRAPNPEGLTRRERVLAHRAGERRPLIVLGAVDRLFGIDNRPLGAQFDWLLHTLALPSTEADFIVTGSPRCERYFTWLFGLADDSRTAVAPNRAGEREHISPGVMARLLGRQVGPAKPPHYSITRVCTRATDATDAEVVRLVGDGYLRLLYNQRQSRMQRTQNPDTNYPAALRMMNDLRTREDIVAGEIEALMIAAVAEWGDEILPIGRLAQEILKALAFISLPTEGDVILAVPAVRRELAQITIDRGQAPGGGEPHALSELLADERVPHCFIAALNLLMKRNLLNVIEPHGEPAEHAPAVPKVPSDQLAQYAIGKRYRFVLHRLVSLVIRDRFDVPLSETVLSDTFNFSLYSALPEDAPAFRPEITSEVEQLVDHLINAYKDVQLAGPLAGRIEKVRHEALKGKVYSQHALVPELLTRLWRYERAIALLDPMVPAALRSAGGVIRSYFSSVNLLGLDLGDPLSRSGRLAVISVHRRRIGKLLDLTLEAQQSRGAYRTGAGSLKKRLDSMFIIRTRVSKPGKPTPQDRRIMEDIETRVDQRSDWPGEAGAVFKAWETVEAGVVTAGDELVVLPEGAAGTVQPLLNRLDRLVAKSPDAGVRRDSAVLNTFPLYKEEIAWLYNEHGMLSFAQGDLYAASTSLRMAVDANARIEGQRYHPNRCRLLLNRCLLWIERGRIGEARRTLNDLEDGIGATPDAVRRDGHEGRLLLGLARGYLGLCDQLNGFTKRAAASYRGALAILGDLREQRSIAIFEMHLGSLLQTNTSKRDEAAACFARAVAAAEGGRHADILYRTRIYQAHNDRLRKAITVPASRAILRRAIEYGEQLDMHRVRVEALSASIQLRLEGGDVDAAAEDCAKALALASQYGMTLRRIWLRVMSGKVYLARNDLVNARLMFESGIEAAERIGFQRAIEDASANLMAMARN